MQVGKADKVLDPSTAKLADKALISILSSEKFESSPQMSAFLRYVVDQTINGNQSRIKAFSVAVDALGKPNSFDPQNDPVVRVLAGRLRTALDAYAYEHPDAPLVISMKKGSYIPIFSGPTIPNDVVNNTDTRQIEDQLFKTDNNIAGSKLSGENAYSRHGVSASTPSSNSANNSLQKAAVPHTTQNPSEEPRGFSIFLERFTCRFRWSIAGVLFAVFGLLHISEFSKNSEPQLRAALTSADGSIGYRNLVKPSMPCIFISAVSSGDAFEDSLNSIVSSALAHNADILVHRILSTDNSFEFGLEDYILSLTSLVLEGESQVNIQLISTTSGRVIHSEPVVLGPNASDEISSSALRQIIEAAESVVASNGPLFEHFDSTSN